jgi:hypothetical protein
MSSVVISGDTSGAVTVSAPAVAGTNTLTLQAATATNAVNTVGTSQATTSGTSVTFTGIPSWARRVTITPIGVSFASSDTHRIQLVTSSTVTSGYLGSAFTPNTNNASSTTSFILLGVAQASTFSGVITLILSTGNTWALSSIIGGSASNNTSFAAGYIALGATLTGFVYSGVGGQTLNAGSINILIEG